MRALKISLVKVGLEGVLDQLAATEAGLAADNGKGGPFWRHCPDNSRSGSPSSASALEEEAAALLRGPVRQAFGALRR